MKECRKEEGTDHEQYDKVREYKVSLYGMSEQDAEVIRCAEREQFNIEHRGEKDRYAVGYGMLGFASGIGLAVLACYFKWKPRNVPE